MKNDITATYEVTDIGRKALEVYRSRDMKDPKTFKDPSMAIQANMEKVFLIGIEQGSSIPEIYQSVLPALSRTGKRIELIDNIFDNMVDYGLIVRVDDVTELSELPSAFKKDFGQYE